MLDCKTFFYPKIKFLALILGTIVHPAAAAAVGSNTFNFMGNLTASKNP